VSAREHPALPVLVLGGSGYVAGELLRLLALHPVFRVAAVTSGSRAGERLDDAFPQLAGTPLGELRFDGGLAIERLFAEQPEVAVFSALPHGEAATRLGSLLDLASSAGVAAHVVDLSADFRHRDPAAFEALYGRPHGAPGRLAEFVCALPEHVAAGSAPPRHVAHPGCFTTAVALALAPLVAGGWIESRVTAVAVTGSTGAGRNPTATTHHPERRSDLFAYAAAGHRHEPEMRLLLAALAPDGGAPEILFVPHSGPFARGIHATLHARLARPASAEELRAALASFYERAAVQANGASGSSFVRVLAAPPRLQSVVGTNRCDLGLALRGEELVLFSAIDNLTKGAAGGGVQWMNRLFGLADATGLVLPGLGWL